MDVFWGWCWDRFGRRYSWAVAVGLWATAFPIFVTLAWVGLRMEDSDRYVVTTVIAAVTVAVMVAVVALPGVPSVWGQVEAWDTDRPSSARLALESTYDFARRSVWRSTLVWPIAGTIILASTARVAGANTSRSVEYALAGAVFGAGVIGIALHSYVEAFLRPVRAAIAGDSDIGDDLPRARPSFATWTSIALLATIVAFAMAGVYFGVVLDAAQQPILGPVIALGLLVGFGIPLTLTTSFGPSLRPLRDLEAATRRVADGHFTQRIPVLQDDDLGVLAASFNRMQAGLAERERLQAAFGSYVDPALAARLLAQGDDIFTGDRVEVTVMFVDIRDFTPFAESHTAEDTVAHLNALFEIVIDVVDDLGGHVNKFLGDGAMVVFGAPERTDDHADRAMACAATIQQRVAARFDGTVRLGIGINTGTVIAGTIGSAKKLEFTLIGDAVNVAARVEQLTKTTGDATLLTQQTFDALATPPAGLADRGDHELKGKAEPVAVYALDHHTATLA